MSELPVITRITFADGEQDFKRWYVRHGLVIACEPFQHSIWIGTKLTGKPVAGEPLKVLLRGGGRGGYTEIKYPVEHVAVIPPAEAVQIYSRYRHWLRLNLMSESEKEEATQ